MTPKQLMRLANTGKSIVWLTGKHMPATFLASMPFRFVVARLPEIKPYRKKRR